MGTASYKRFTKTETLKAIATEHLVAFLTRYGDYFAQRGVPLPAASAAEPIPYDELVKVFLDPDTTTPPDLSEALYFVDEMSTPDGMDDLLAEASKGGITISGKEDPTPEDVAIQVWLAAPKILERRHEHKAIERSRSFDYYHATTAPTKKFDRSPASALRAMQKDMDDWFTERKCGRGTRVTSHHRGNEIWFLIEHGDQVVRAPALDASKPTVHFYRPQKSDILVYDHRIEEIRVNARTPAIKDQYRRVFGRHLFGDDDFFSPLGKYTLAPLFGDGPASLSCDGIDGIDSVKLVEVQFDEGGSQGEVEIRKADDLFAAWKDSKRGLDRDRTVAHVKFEVRFSGSRKTRKVTLRPPNRAMFGRDADSAVIEEWLAKNGFARNRGTDGVGEAV